MDESGVLHKWPNVQIDLYTEPMKLEEITRVDWLSRVKALRETCSALGVVGMSQARSYMRRSPGERVMFDSGSGFVSSIGKNIAAYLEAEVFTGRRHHTLNILRRFDDVWARLTFARFARAVLAGKGVARF